MKRWLKWIANAVALVVVSPVGLLCWLEKQTRPDHEAVFQFWTHVLAVAPGVPGMYLRRAFYHLTLDVCSLRSYIGFGAVFSHRRVEVGDEAYVGLYAIIGSSKLGEGCLIGSRASILSGGALHELDERGRWDAFSWSRLKQVEIGAHAWIGEAAVVMADVGSGTIVTSGAVVSTPVPERVMVGGNPARFVRSLAPAAPQAVPA